MKLLLRVVPLIFICLTLTLTATPALSLEAPTLAFSTYLGGGVDDLLEDMAVDSAGNIYVTGTTHSNDYPSDDPLPAQLPAIFVTKFDPTGTTVLYSVLLGGGSGFSIEVDAAGYAYVTGTAWELQTANAYQPTYAGMLDGFVAKLDPTGTPVFLSYLGGTNIDEARALAVDSAGNIIIAGTTRSANFPLVNPAQAVLSGGYDLFITKLNAAGTALIYSTYYGSTTDDTPADMVVDTAGSAYVTGSWNFNNTFVLKWSPAGALVYERYLVSSGGNGIALDIADSVVVVGTTQSTTWPVKNAYQESITAGTVAGFIVRLSPNGSTLLYSTYFGNPLTVTEIYDVAVDKDSRIYVAGITRDPGFPLVQPLQAIKGGGAFSHDNFITQFAPDGKSLQFSTYWGGSDDERHIVRLATGDTGAVMVAGSTLSTDFPMLNAFQDTHAGAGIPPITNSDTYLTKFTLPAPVQATVPQANYFTTSTPSLSWNPVSWAVGYRLEVDAAPPEGTAPFTTALEYEAVIDASTRQIVTSSLPDGLYYWRVSAQRANGAWGNPSATQRFIITTVLP